MFREPVAGPRSARAVFPGTFDPFTDGHRDIVDRARRLFAHVTVLVAVNEDKRPTRTSAERALDLCAAIPSSWENVTVAAWTGLTVAYCQQDGSGVIIRGVREATEGVREHQLAAMNEALGITTLFMPARPELATISSTSVRAAGT